MLGFSIAGCMVHAIRCRGRPRDGMGYQVALGGAKDRVAPTVEAVWTDGARSEKIVLTGPQAQGLMNRGILAAAIAARMATDHPRPFHGKDQTSRNLNMLIRWSVPFLFALKRAGDWGQVEHCARYRKIFFTMDRLAALYAHMRGVPYVFIMVDELYTPLTFALTRFVVGGWRADEGCVRVRRDPPKKHRCVG